jgi:Fe-S-cluster containining protein
MENGGKAVRYECTRCGACCRWAGDVCIETDEIREISRFLDMDEQVFIDTCCRLRANRRGLSIRDAEDGACMMLTKDGCRINPVNPASAGIFPTNGIFPAGGICAAPEKWGRNGKHNMAGMPQDSFLLPALFHGRGEIRLESCVFYRN